MTYTMLKKKSYTVIYWGKNVQLQRFGKEIIGRRLTQTKSPIPPPPSPRPKFTRVPHVMVLKFQDLTNTPIKTQMDPEEKVQKNAQFPFCGQTRTFRYEIVFRGTVLLSAGFDFAFGIEKLPDLSRNRPRWKAVLCFICLVCIQNQSINNFENDKMQN